MQIATYSSQGALLDPDSHCLGLDLEGHSLFLVLQVLSWSHQ